MPAARVRTVSRISGALAVVLAVAAALLTFVAPRAEGLEQQRITLTTDEVKEVSFGPVPGNNPANDAYTPEICKAAPYCDTIPVTFVRPPDFDSANEYFIQIQLTWDSRKIPDPLEASGERAINDMDMFIYNDPIQEQAGTNQDGVIANGATGGEPETAYLTLPEGNYSVVIVNFVGVNTGYKLKLTWVSQSITSPYESLAPGITTTPPARPTVTPSARPFAAPAPTPSSGYDVPDAGAALTLPPAEIVPDAAFDSGFEEDSTFEQSIVAPPRVDLQPIKKISATPPSGLAVVLWMLVLPLALVAVGGAYLHRRSTTLIKI